MKAIIVGGGIGGITAGIALKYIGWDVTVFEQADKLREVGAGITIWSNAIKALNKIEAGDAVLAAGSISLERGEVRTRRNSLLATVPADEIKRRTGTPTIAIHRANLIDALHQCLGSDLQTGSRCTSIRQTRHEVTAVLAGGHEESGDVLIAADGIRSVVREQLHGQQDPRYAGYIV